MPNSGPLPPRLRLLALVLLLVAVPVIAFASVEPRLAPPDAYGFDKLVHASTFFVLAGLGVAAARNRRDLVIAIVLIAAFGAGIEVCQMLVKGRDGSVWDFAGDLVGIAAGTAVMLIVGKDLILAVFKGLFR